jgi:hypothetical protein
MTAHQQMRRGSQRGQERPAGLQHLTAEEYERIAEAIRGNACGEQTLTRRQYLTIVRAIREIDALDS